MKLEIFFEKFDQFADAPGAVGKMRELVLRLAFSGGLTGKRPTETGVPDGWESRTIESISSSITPGFACSRSNQVENGHFHLRTHNISTLGTLNFDPFEQQVAASRATAEKLLSALVAELAGTTSRLPADL